MGTCALCGAEGRRISSFLRLCPSCARSPDAREIGEEAHRRSLRTFGLSMPAGSVAGARCGQCVNQCVLGPGEVGRCGVRANRLGRIAPVAEDDALVDWYYDPLPTNCVAEWVCGADDLCGGKMKNLAVFFHGCSFDCLFCQNWTHKAGVLEGRPRRTLNQLIRSADKDTFCVCFFGGDPTPQMQFALAACDRWNELGTPVRVCWETNGSMSSGLADRMGLAALRTGGTVKFDLKAFDENLHRALCGTSNFQTLENFRRLARRIEEAERAFLVASTLLVPGYVGEEEVRAIASFIADINPEIPYSLLGFHPDYLMDDLPATSLADARSALAAATGAGLKRVHLGNIHLLA